MKKLFFIGLAAAAMLASCSNDETVEQAPQKAISFSTFVNNGTRNIDPSITKANILDFDVYGFTQNGQIFDGVKVSRPDANGAWTYSPLQYWIAGNTYTFGALAPSGAATVTNERVDGAQVAMDVAFVNNGNTDLLLADGVQMTGDAPAVVGLNFHHLLSKVKFSFTNAIDGYEVKVTDIKINNAYRDANLTIDANQIAWGQPINNILHLNFGNAVVGTSTDGVAMPIKFNETGVSYEEKLMIPAVKPSPYFISFSVELLKDGVSLKTYNHSLEIPVDMNMGYSYNLEATLTDKNIDPVNPLNPIEFTVTGVDDWGIGAGMDIK